MRTWQIQEAETCLSELIRDTERLGPQFITWHGREVAVVLCKGDYERLTETAQSLVEFIRRSPLFDTEDIALDRDTSTTRQVNLEVI